jgi:hypothetical protein
LRVASVKSPFLAAFSMFFRQASPPHSFRFILITRSLWPVPYVAPCWTPFPGMAR